MIWMTKSLSVERLFLYIEKNGYKIKRKNDDFIWTTIRKEQNDVIPNVQKAEQLKQQEQQQQQASSADWTAGIDVVSLASDAISLASDVIETVGDALSDIDLSF